MAGLSVAVAGMILATPPVPADTPATRPVLSSATPEAAAELFAKAAKAGDTAAMQELFCPDGHDILDSGDPTADRNAREAFVKAYDERHAVSVTPGGMSATLEVGNDRWPMPVPLVKRENGWAFDAAAGREEILDRRIGHNELDAINVLHAIVDAQQEYVRLDPDHDGVPAYADRFASRPGRHDGLYWPTEPGQADSPLGPLIDRAADEGYADPATRPTTAPAVSPRTPYHGYYYRILTGQGPAATGGAMDYRINGRLVGGFGVVAWPADYGNSGVMSFVVNQQGVVYQRDLGENTATAVRDVRAYDPGGDWHKAEEK